MTSGITASDLSELALQYNIAPTSKLLSLATTLFHIVTMSTTIVQVKSILHQQIPDDNAALDGPLAEYNFWKGRAEDLKGLLLQVRSAGDNPSRLARKHSQHTYAQMQDMARTYASRQAFRSTAANV